jgi:hypothetical protein
MPEPTRPLFGVNLSGRLREALKKEGQMPAMPYMFEVGRILSWVVDYCEDPAHLATLHQQLHDGIPLTQIEALLSPNPDNATIPDPVNLGGSITPAEHIARDWLGWPLTAGSYAPPQPAWNPANPKRTGWWIQWHGDAEKILRETLLCATEIALDIPRGGAPTTQSSPRHWHMQFLWVCGAPFLQGWVNWQEWDENDDAGGMVTVTFTTPGNGHKLYATPEAPSGALPTPDDDYEDPATTVEEYGLWVIGETETEVVPLPGIPWSISGLDFLPPWANAFVHTSGNVVVVSPAELDGGVLEDGRPWGP